MEIFGPIFHVGCFTAWAGVISSSSSNGRFRNGPPLAVMTSFDIPSCPWACMSSSMAECSLSTGIILQPVASALLKSTWPPSTTDSLLARASVLEGQLSIAWNDALSPGDPAMPFRMVCGRRKESISETSVQIRMPFCAANESSWDLSKHLPVMHRFGIPCWVHSSRAS